MSKTILQKLFDGEIYPSESIICTDPKYRQVAHKLIGSAIQRKALSVRCQKKTGKYLMTSKV